MTAAEWLLSAVMDCEAMTEMKIVAIHYYVSMHCTKFPARQADTDPLPRFVPVDSGLDEHAVSETFF